MGKINSKKKSVLILGGAGGVGQAISNLFLKNNFFVFVADIKIPEVTKKIESKDIFYYRVDFSNEGLVKKTINDIRKKRQIDVVVLATTPPLRPQPYQKKTWKNFSVNIDIITKSLFLAAKYLADQIKSGHKTKFIVISSEACLGNPPLYLSDYVVAKYSLLGLAKCLALELAKYNSTVNIITPGMIRTGLIDSLPSKLVESVEQGNPLKRIGNPEEIAYVALFLASDGANYLNGSNITVNGGSLMF